MNINTFDSIFNQHNAVKASEVIEIIPIARIFLSIENIVRKVLQKSTLAINNEEAVYDNHVRFKENYRIILGLIPLLGDLILLINDLSNRKLGNTSRMKYSKTDTLWEAMRYAYNSSARVEREQILAVQNKLLINQYTFASGNSHYNDDISGDQVHYFDLIITSNYVKQIKADNNKILVYPYGYTQTT